MKRRTERGIWVTLIILLLPFMLGGCGWFEEWKGTGVVVEKLYDDPDSWYTPGYTVSGSESCSGGYNNTPRTCTRSADVHIPGQWHHDSEHFILVVRDDKDNKDHEAYVHSTTWHACRIHNGFSTTTQECTSR